MPLSAPVSEVEAVCRLVVDGVCPTFFRALRVLIGEISIPKPRDQARCFSWRVSEAGEGSMGWKKGVPCCASKPQKVGKGMGLAVSRQVGNRRLRISVASMIPSSGQEERKKCSYDR
jgi:hypothetical protein